MNTAASHGCTGVSVKVTDRGGLPLTRLISTYELRPLEEDTTGTASGPSYNGVNSHVSDAASVSDGSLSNFSLRERVTLEERRVRVDSCTSEPLSPLSRT